MSIFTESTNSFKGQLPQETTILVVRKHWIVLFGPIALIMTTLFFPLIIYSFIAGAPWYPLFSNIFCFFTAAYFLVLWNLLFYNIMICSLNTVIITDKRVVENQQKALFGHEVNELERIKIQDITVKTYGVLASLLNYGDIEIQTAATLNKFYFRTLPNPRKIKNMIMGRG